MSLCLALVHVNTAAAPTLHPGQVAMTLRQRRVLGAEDAAICVERLCNALGRSAPVVALPSGNFANGAPRSVSFPSACAPLLSMDGLLLSAGSV